MNLFVPFDLLQLFFDFYQSQNKQYLVYDLNKIIVLNLKFQAKHQEQQ
jgi:hypothetical protein